jgi:L-iditol 2-dehydrogenase
MKALVNTAPYKLEVQDWPIPEVGPEDILVQVKACAICGSDVKGYSGKTGRRQPPIIMGHEAAGVVAAVGDQVTGFKVGDAVTFDSTVYCQKCHYCLSGYINLCENRRVLGVSTGAYRQHGAMAEYVRVPYWIAVHMPEGMSFAHAAMIEPVSIGVHAANRTPITLNNSVLVVGAGPIGLCALQAIRLRGAGKIIVTDLFASRLELAKKLGADVALKADDPNLLDQIRQVAGRYGVDAAIEAVGVESAVATALSAVREGGSLALVGNVAPTVNINLQSIVTREISIYGVTASNGEFKDCVELVASGRIQVEPLISEYAKIEDGQAVFDRLYKGAEGHIKSVFTF